MLTHYLKGSLRHWRKPGFSWCAVRCVNWKLICIICRALVILKNIDFQMLSKAHISGNSSLWGEPCSCSPLPASPGWMETSACLLFLRSWEASLAPQLGAVPATAVASVTFPIPCWDGCMLRFRNSVCLHYFWLYAVLKYVWNPSPYVELQFLSWLVSQWRKLKRWSVPWGYMCLTCCIFCSNRIRESLLKW